ncbi:MAG: hypothetical protein RIC38_03435 [Chromatocurvus sp.]
MNTDSDPRRRLAVTSLFLFAADVAAQGADRLEEIAVYGRAQQQIGSARSASEGLVGYDDIAYYYASRLPGEPANGVDDVHFHPLEPRAIRASIAWHIGH